MDEARGRAEGGDEQAARGVRGGEGEDAGCGGERCGGEGDAGGGVGGGEGCEGKGGGGGEGCLGVG